MKLMHEHVTWEQIEKWVKEKHARSQHAEKIGKLIIEVGEGVIGLKDPKTGLLQIINPKDFEIKKLSVDAELIAHKKDEGHYMVYVIDPGSDKLVLLELILEKKMFGVYSKDFELGGKITKKNYIVIDHETAAICIHKVLYVIRGGSHVGITLEVAGINEIKHPVFGVGESEEHIWLAVMEKGASEALLVCLTDSDLGYAVRRKEGNELKDKELMEED